MEEYLMEKDLQQIGYLPDERPPIWKLLLYALQQVLVMFPATIAVALITGFPVSTTIFASGLATICFILVTGRKIPLYYGSSFSYLSAILGLLKSADFKAQLSNEAVRIQLNEALEKLEHGEFALLPKEAISYVLFGIILSGLISIAAGLLVRLFGTKTVEKFCLRPSPALSQWLSV